MDNRMQETTREVARQIPCGFWYVAEVLSVSTDAIKAHFSPLPQTKVYKGFSYSKALRKGRPMTNDDVLKNMSINESLDWIAKKATKEIKKIYKECGFNNPPVLSNGIVAQVLAAYELRKKFVAKERKNAAKKL